MKEDILSIGNAYRHNVVRDLVWAIISPPLMRQSGPDCQWFDTDWYRQRYDESSSWLKQIDDDPTPLLQLVAEQKDRRLGNYFETLWRFWLEASQRYDLLEHNLPIREGVHTFGELDFLVRDRETGFNYHWELAVKFYLGVADTRQASNWHGPGKRDRLDIKLEHLRDRQSQMCHLPQTQELLRAKGIDVAGSAVILKGRLFYPGVTGKTPVAPRGASRDHLRGQWFRLSEYRSSISKNDRFQPLIRSGWMADHVQEAPETEAYCWPDIEGAIRSGLYRLPLYLVRISGRKRERQFLVPDDWDSAL